VKIKSDPPRRQMPLRAISAKTLSFGPMLASVGCKLPSFSGRFQRLPAVRHLRSCLTPSVVHRLSANIAERESVEHCHTDVAGGHEDRAARGNREQLRHERGLCVHVRSTPNEAKDLPLYTLGFLSTANRPATIIRVSARVEKTRIC
jgi:hypothetical protein